MKFGISRKVIFVSTVLAFVSLLQGCATDPTKTGSVGSSRNSKALEQMSVPELNSAVHRYGRKYEKNPKDKATGLQYANVLRMVGRHEQALAVMHKVAIHHPTDNEVLAAYGKALAAQGNLPKALDVIRRAQRPDHPDWRLMSAEGAILDQIGKSGEARNMYRKALDLKPNEASILSNMGISYLLAGDLRSSEVYLRKAIKNPGADSRVRQNLSLVVGLQGRFDEAETIAKGELPPAEAQENIAYLRKMLSQQSAWNQLKEQDKKKKQ